MSILLVEQNATLALDLADHAYLMETGKVAMCGHLAGRSRKTTHPSRLSRATERNRAWKEFLHQVLSGLAPGGVYASIALALVMIYQATASREFRAGRDGDVLDLYRLDADRDRAAVLGRVLRHRRRLVHRRGRDRAAVIRPVRKCADLVAVVVFIGLC